MALNLNRVPMPTQDADVRNKNFKEVATGYTAAMAKEEADRCLQCKKPLCVPACPVNINIPKFIAEIAEGNVAAAGETLKDTNALPAVCGRVCPQESQCEGACVLNKKGAPVAIGRLERYAADLQIERGDFKMGKKPSTGKKVAILGGGPAGLTCASELAKEGHAVTIYEALHCAGGVLMYGIPEFRLPKDIVQTEISAIEELGVEIKVNNIAGKINTVDELMKEEGFDAVFIGTGAGLPYFLNIPGENYNGVYSANEFLTRTNLMKAYDFPNNVTPIMVGDAVAVVGAGNVAMDAARTALRLGAKKSYIVYRRAIEQVPARKEELEHAIEEGVELKLLTSPTEILGNEEGWVTGMTCLSYELGEPDDSGRRRPVVIEGSEHLVEVDTVVMAIGQGPNPVLLETIDGLELNKWGNVVADESGKTSIEGVYAGGDIVTGAATVILAMGAGKDAAKAMNEYLSNK